MSIQAGLGLMAMIAWFQIMQINLTNRYVDNKKEGKIRLKFITLKYVKYKLDLLNEKNNVDPKTI